MTGPDPLEVAADLRAREPLLHRPGFGTTRREAEELISADFCEVGASGQRYSREDVLAVVAGRTPGGDEDWQVSDFACRELAPGRYLATYTLDQGTRLTRRATIWRRTDGGWTALFHQGTIVQAAARGAGGWNAAGPDAAGSETAGNLLHYPATHPPGAGADLGRTTASDHCPP